jgi:hypothetical protein
MAAKAAAAVDAPILKIKLDGHMPYEKLAAKEKGCKLMVGNMVGTSLGMTPSFVVAQLCDFVDIDGPLLLKYDHPLGLEYNKGVVQGIDPRLWG